MTDMNREAAYALAAEHEAEAAAMDRSGAPSAAEFHLRTAAALRQLAADRDDAVLLAESHLATAESLRKKLHIQNEALAALREERDAEMERVKACEHIAECDEGWEKLRNLCPSTAAVAALVDTNISLTKAMNDFRDEYGKLLEEREREERLLDSGALLQKYAGAGGVGWGYRWVFNHEVGSTEDDVWENSRAESARLAEAKGERK